MRKAADNVTVREILSKFGMNSKPSCFVRSIIPRSPECADINFGICNELPEKILNADVSIDKIYVAAKNNGNEIRAIFINLA